MQRRNTEPNNLVLQQIAEVRSSFPSKFGIPRQSGLAESVEAQIVFLRAFRNPNCVRGLKGFSHIWVLWGFSASARHSDTVRPPRLGGSQRVGVFASRSPFRPNPIAMSCVALLDISYGEDGPVLRVSGADMLDGSPVYDVKPYVPADCRPEADFSYAGIEDKRLEILDPSSVLDSLPREVSIQLCEILSLDPRPAYHEDPDRVYGMEYAGFDVHFRASERTITIRDAVRAMEP